MDIETIATGGGSAAVVWVALKLFGAWVVRQRWALRIESESLAAMAKDRDELRERLQEAEAVARVCRAHMDSHLRKGEHDANQSNG